VRPFSKTQYVRGLSCARRLWLDRERPDLARERTEAEEGILRQGDAVGRLARELFPGGVKIRQDHRDPAGAIRATREAMAARVPAIYEAAFQHEDILVRVDILARNPEKTHDLIEVKSSTSVKPEHLHDVAIQKHVLTRAGIKLRRSCLAHINSDYVRSSEVVNVLQLFRVVPMDKEIDPYLAAIVANMKNLRELARRGSEPEAAIGSVCKKPYGCEFRDHCWQGVDEKSIHVLGRINDKMRAALLSQGIKLLSQIPADFELTDAQRAETDCARAGKARLDRTHVREHLSALKWPRYFLDFESVGFAIPEYLRTKPYEPLTFQYSLDIQKTEGGPIEHREFIVDVRSGDPRPAVARRLVQDIGPEGSVVAYHASFERARIADMIALVPADVAAKLQSIEARVWDLERPFRKRWYWDPRFKGSSSIKSVLPVVVPSLDYKGLAIQGGNHAQQAYAELLKLRLGEPRREELRHELLEYCALDTRAMVEVLRFLEALARR
jgi:hypothetical protein